MIPPFARHVLMVLETSNLAYSLPAENSTAHISTGEEVARFFFDYQQHSVKELREAFPGIDRNRMSLFVSRFKRNGFVLDGRRYFLNRIRHGVYAIKRGLDS